MIGAAAVAAGVIATRGGGGRAATASTFGDQRAPADTAPKTHSVAVDSTPQGATVREGDRALGTTPMTLEIDPSGPPRKFVIVLEGYSPHTFIPTREDTRITVPLALLAAPSQPPPAPRSRRRRTRPPKPVTRVVVVPATPPPAPARPQAPSDINTAR